MRRRPSKWDRADAVGHARSILASQGWPRVQMTFMLLLTGSVGFLLSYALLHAGVTSMALRYPVVIFLSYGVFLLLLRGWLALQRPRPQRSLADGLDLVPDVPLDFGSGGGGGASAPTFGGGGDFGGGGAGGSWSGGGGSSSSSSSSGLFDRLDVDLPVDGDEGCGVVVAVLAVVVAAVAGLFATLYVIYMAPALLAEILVDGLLVTGLYRRMRHVEEQHWLATAVRRTLLPVALTLICFTAAGYLMQRAAPEAHSMAGFWRSITAAER